MEISGEIPAEKFGAFWDRAVKEISSRTEIPGFRKGLTPEKILIEKIGEGEILEEAAQLTLREAWPKILEEEKIEALGRPEIVITKLARGNPMGFKIKTAVLPEVKLPDYKKILKEILSRPEEGGETPEQKLKLLEKKRMEILDSISQQSEIEPPLFLIEVEKQKMLAELKASLLEMGLAFEHYLDHIKKTEEELGAEWKNEAEKRVRYGLVLREIARTEKIEVLEAELAQEIDRFLSRYLPSERGRLDQKRIRDYAYGIIRNEKVFKLLENGK